MRSFVKWVGGKRQLLAELVRHLPPSGRYFEPFVGGGSVFFSFAELQRFEQAFLSDTNEELINCYQVVRDQPECLMSALDRLQRDSDWASRPAYNRLRASNPDLPIDRAARFIVLNKLCYNGLYRVNRSGKFNSPYGRYANPTVYDRASLLACSVALRRFAELRCADYSAAVSSARPGDVVYFDPPYVPISASSSFTAYSHPFGSEQQAQLAQTFRGLVARGVYCVLSNSDAPEVHELYDGFAVHIVEARRSVNSDPAKRSPINEVIVVGRPGAWVAPSKLDIFQELERLCTDSVGSVTATRHL